METVFDAVDVGEVFVVGFSQLARRENYFCPGGRASVDAEQRIQRVGASLDLLYASAFDGTEVQDSAIGWAHLFRPKSESRRIGWRIKAAYVPGLRQLQDESRP